MPALAQEVTMAFQKRIRLTGSFEQREGEIGEYVWSMNLCYPPDVISHGRRERLTQGRIKSDERERLLRDFLERMRGRRDRSQI